LGVVAIAFIIYYQFSKNNQTLRKVKRYGDMIQSDLQVFVEEKTNEIKDIAVELEVHQKTGKGNPETDHPDRRSAPEPGP
jgi:hypothetical protein